MDTFFVDRNNEFIITLSNDGAPYPLALTTKVEVRWIGGSANSVDNPTVVSYDGTEITLNLGLSSIEPGVHHVALVLYDDLHPLGVVWDPDLLFKIESV